MSLNAQLLCQGRIWLVVEFWRVRSQGKHTFAGKCVHSQEIPSPSKLLCAIYLGGERRKTTNFIWKWIKSGSSGNIVILEGVKVIHQRSWLEPEYFVYSCLKCELDVVILAQQKNSPKLRGLKFVHDLEPPSKNDEAEI